MHNRNQQNPKANRWSDFKLWEQWVLATAVSGVLGFGIVAIASVLVQQLSTVSIVGILHIVGLLQGTVLGIAQWFVLRHRIQHPGRWIGVTIAGALVAWMTGVKAGILLAIISSLGIDATRYLLLLRGVVIIGAWVGSVVGLAQWFILRTRLRRAAWWIPANALAWAIGILVSFLGVGMIAPAQEWSLRRVLTEAATGMLSGAVIGALTGIVLIWLLKSRPDKP